MTDLKGTTAGAPAASCILPARDAAPYIGEAVRSVLAQTYRPIEILVVDDGSSDDTAGVSRAVDSRVAVITQPASGPAAARNRGVDAAQGAFVAFLDADDTWHPDKLARQIALLQARPDVAICLCQVQPVPVPDLPNPADLDLAPSVMPATLVARREVFTTVGPFNPSLRYTDAVDWLARARAAGVAMEILAEPLYYRRLHAANLSLTESAAARAEMLRLVRESVHR